MNAKNGATAVLIVMGVIYAIMLLKGINPPAGFEQIMVGAAATIFVAGDRKALSGGPTAEAKA
jgi:hypothetical protein